MAGRAEQLHVVVVGAGMAGLGAALAIRHAGHQVTVLEQAAEFGEVCITAHPLILQSRMRMCFELTSLLRRSAPAYKFRPILPESSLDGA